MSLAPYSERTGDSLNDRERSEQGKSIYWVKYSGMDTPQERRQLVSDLTKEIQDLISKELGMSFPDPRLRPPFDICLAVPSNRPGSISFPKAICESLARGWDWLHDGSSSVTKTRSIPIIKSVPPSEREQALRGAYSFNGVSMPRVRHGFLIVDDVFETGSTIRAMCSALEDAYPAVPRYVIALTHIVKSAQAKPS